MSLLLAGKNFFERRSRSIPARRLPYCKNRTYAPVTLCQGGHRSRKLLIPLDFAPSRLHEADAGSAERSCFDAPHVRMAACTMHCFGSSRSSFAPSPVSFKVANDVWVTRTRNMARCNMVAHEAPVRDLRHPYPDRSPKVDRKRRCADRVRPTRATGERRLDPLNRKEESG